MLLSCLLLLGCDPPAVTSSEQSTASSAAPSPAAAPPAAAGARGGAAHPGGVAPPVGGPAPLHLDPDLQLVGERAAHPHNILVISMDTVRADRLSVYGGRAETPALAALAAQGARFDQAISNFPETCLSHQAMLSGVLPEVHGNVPAAGGSRYRGPNLAEVAASQGYATAGFIGGVTLTDRSCGFGRGFSVFDDRFPLDPTDMKRPGDQVTAAAAAWIADQPGPWLAFVHYFDAHFPYTPAPPWDARYDPDYAGSIDGSDVALRPFRDGGLVPSPRDLAHVLALYDGELSELDQALAPLLAAVGGADAVDDTVVVVTSDHGESFEHGYFFNHRAGLWDGVLHVPLLIRAPGVPAGRTVDAPVQLIDIAPTVLDLAGLPYDARMQGRSLVPLLRDGLEVPEERPSFSITDPWMPGPQWAARTADAKVITGDAGVLAYDLARDPGEEQPLDEPPAALLSTRADYDGLVEALAPWQAEPVAPRALSADEQQRLEALGYLAPAGTAPPSGGRRGPPGPPPQNTPLQKPPLQNPPLGEPPP